MPVITLPDGSKRNFDQPIKVIDVAVDISPALARAVVVATIDGELTDLTTTITDDCQLVLLKKNDDRALGVIRHSLAHILAQAVQRLYPGSLPTVGPVTDHGFFYDFYIPHARVGEHDLARIEQTMREIIKEDQRFIRQEVSRKAADSMFHSNSFKRELLAEIPEGDTITVYEQYESNTVGPIWYDLCRGPHVSSTSVVGDSFKLTKIAGSYWRGDSARTQLVRISGIAFADDKALARFETQHAEAEKRDHRKLGPQLDLFHFEDKAPGSVFWHPKGWTLFQGLISYMRKRQNQAGYQEINTPDMMDKSLWELSGHWQNYHANMFTTTTEDGREFAFKPMNCPGHMMVYNQGIRSYRELPLRYSEFGKVHRYEPSGALHGLLRVRSFTQDDAHIFCTEDQLLDECKSVNDLIMSIYKDFGFQDVRIKLSTRPANRIGSDESWDRAEQSLAQALDELGLEYTLYPGEGAFYGPKLEYVLTDAIGRDWQCGTLQVDFNLPERFDSTYVDNNGNKQHPVMLHRALFGSLERFTGILIEHFEGKIPAWLAPTQVVVLSVSEKSEKYANDINSWLSDIGIRAEADLSANKISAKVALHSSSKVPILLVIGEEEVKKGGATMRLLGSNTNQFYHIGELRHQLKAICRIK